MPLEKKTKELIEQKVNELGYSLIEIKFQKEKSDNFLHITIDRDDVINLDDIVIVSDSISKLLDELDPIEENYILDVASLGAEKPIKTTQLDKYINKYVWLHLSHPYKGENILQGIIKEVIDNELVLITKNKTTKKEIKIIIADIDKARLAIEF